MLGPRERLRRRSTKSWDIVALTTIPTRRKCASVDIATATNDGFDADPGLPPVGAEVELPVGAGAAAERTNG